MEKRRSRRYRRPSPNDPQPEQPIGVTVLAERPFERGQHICESKHFDETKLGEITPHVESCRRSWPNKLVIIIVEVTRPEPTASRHVAPGQSMRKLLTEVIEPFVIQLTDRRYPRHIIDSLMNERLRQPYNPGEGGVVPGNAAWVLKYRGGNGHFHDHAETGSEKAIRLLNETTWIAAWVGQRVDVPATATAGKCVRPPMAVITILRHPSHTSSDRNFYGKLMTTQYKTKGITYRWLSLRDQPLFIFMDLDRMFNGFSVNVATANLEVNEYMVSDYSISGKRLPPADQSLIQQNPSPHDRRYGVIPRVARLRTTLALLSKFKQEFKTHEIAQKSMERILQHYVKQSTDRSERNSERLFDRLYELGNEVETVNLEVDMLREQCIYLMDAEFNTVAARTDARLGILTVLAYVLTPAGFVLTLFSVIDAGTTQLIISTVVVGFFSVVVYVVVDLLYKSAEQKELPSRLAASGVNGMNGMRSDSNTADEPLV